jgi:hypothetical protein
MLNNENRIDDLEERFCKIDSDRYFVAGTLSLCERKN